jgi:hypothetical protein
MLDAMLRYLLPLPQAKSRSPKIVEAWLPLEIRWHGCVSQSLSFSNVGLELNHIRTTVRYRFYSFDSITE